MLIQSIVVYTGLAILMFFLVKKSAKSTGFKAWICYSFAVLAFSVVFGIRYGVGIDYANYLELYEQWGDLAYAYRFVRMEPAYLLITYLSYEFNIGVGAYFTIFSFLQIFFIFYAFKNEKTVLAYATLIFIFSGLAMLGFMNIIRQSIAFTIFLFSIKYIIERSFVRYILILLLAASFHKSSLILFPLYFFYHNNRVWFRTRIGMLIMLVLSVFFAISGFASYFTAYLDNLIVLLGYESYLDEGLQISSMNLGLSFILDVTIWLLLIAFYPNVKCYYGNCRRFEILFDLYFLGICMTLFFSGSMMTDRLFVYFTNFSFIILGYYLNCFINRMRIRRSFYTPFVILCTYILLSFARIIVYSEKNTISYVTIFQEDKHWIKDKQRFEMIHNR